MIEDELTGESPEEAFSLVANETRFDILRALWVGEHGPRAFSEVYDEVDIRDSGRFNYHLDKLVPEFVRQTEAGYELTYAGRQIIGAAISGTYTDSDVSIAPIEVSDCPTCTGRIEASYTRGVMEIKCPECELVITNALPAPPILAVHHDREELPVVFSRLLITRAQAEGRGFCDLCGGPISRSLAAEREAFSQDALTDHLAVELTCDGCGRTSHQLVGWAVLDHPAVVSFFHDHGFDIRDLPVWELYDRWLAEPHATVLSENPTRIQATLTLGEERLELTLAGDLTVSEYKRVAIE